MWRVKFIYYHPIIELEDECYLDFDAELSAWKFYQDAIRRCPNILSCCKPIKIY